MSTLDPETKRLIALAQEAADPDPHVESRVLSRIIDAIESGPPPDGGPDGRGDPGPGHGPASAPVTGLAAKVAVMLLPVAAGIGLLASRAHSEAADPTPPPIETTAAPDPAPRAPRAPAAAPPEPAADLPVTVSAVAPPPPAPPDTRRPAEASTQATRGATPRTDPPPPAESPQTLTAELEAVSSAQRALRSSKHAEALRAVRAYQREFPDGQLADEAAAIEIEALCGMDSIDEARARAKAFATTFPSSLQRAKVDRSCGAD